MLRKKDGGELGGRDVFASVAAPFLAPATKTCSICKETKLREDFMRRHSKSKDGYYGQCRQCMNARSRKWWADHPDKKSFAHRRWRSRNRAYTIWYNARARAKRRNVEFELTADWIRERIEKGRCEATGIEFDLGVSDWTGLSRPFRPSLDRVNPRKGYTLMNTKMVCTIYNLCKNAFSHEDVLIFARKFSSTQGE